MDLTMFLKCVMHKNQITLVSANYYDIFEKTMFKLSMQGINAINLLIVQTGSMQNAFTMVDEIVKSLI